jgi:Mn2+/Fe2+ NRAMP family transporter
VERGRCWVFLPTFSRDLTFWTTVVAILGTTISPYLFFWQASQEAEDTKEEPHRKPLAKAPPQAPNAIERIRTDTYVGMAFSNLVALAIMLTTAATLHVAGVHEVESSAQAAEALRPVAGEAAFVIFALGIIGTGLLAVPVLAGSAACAVGEARRWPVGLARQPLQAKAFYMTIAVAVALGVAMNMTAINPIKALYWSAVLNGIVAVPVMAMMMLISTNKRIMGKFTVGPVMRSVGWVATGVMAAAVLGMGIAAFG